MPTPPRAAFIDVRLVTADTGRQSCVVTLPDPRRFTNWPDFKVIREQRRRELDWRKAVVRVPDPDPWKWAVAWASPLMPGRCTRCPLSIWYMDRRTGHVYTVDRDCLDYKWCQSCAVQRVKEEIARARCLFWKHSKVWVSVVPYEPAIKSRLSKRRSRLAKAGHGPVGCYWVHRLDTNTIHIYATHDLSAMKKDSRDEPISGRWMTSVAAARHLAAVSVVTPGVGAWRWSGKWSRTGKKRPPPHSFPLSEQPWDLMQEAISDAESMLVALSGRRSHHLLSTPDEIERMWLPLVNYAIRRRWELRKKSKSRA